MDLKYYLTPMNVGIAVCIVIILALGIVWLKKVKANKNEEYTSSSLSHIGGLSDYNNLPRYPPENYDIMKNYGSQYNPFFPMREGFNQNYQNAQNANSQNSQNSQNQLEHATWNERRTLDRLDRIDADLLPKISTNVTPYNVDVADPVAYTYQVHAPRVIRKDRLAMEADPIRGDVPIMMYPDVPLVQRSQYNRDSLRLDGAFSEALAKSYDRLTGKSYFNQPSQLSHGGMLM